MLSSQQKFSQVCAGYFIRWSCRFAPAPSGETVPVWAGCTQSAHPSHTRTEAKK